MELKRPSPEPAPTRTGSWITVVTAACMFVGAVGAIALVSFPMAIAILAMFALVAFHYIAWGWWLGAALSHEATDDET